MGVSATSALGFREGSPLSQLPLRSHQPWIRPHPLETVRLVRWSGSPLLKALPAAPGYRQGQEGARRMWTCTVGQAEGTGRRPRGKREQCYGGLPVRMALTTPSETRVKHQKLWGTRDRGWLPQQSAQPAQLAGVNQCVLPPIHRQTSLGPGRGSQACALLLTPDWGLLYLHQTDSPSDFSCSTQFQDTRGRGPPTLPHTPGPKP